MRQPIKAGCQIVAKAIEPGKQLSKDNNLKSSQRNHSEISTESTWQLPNGQSRQEMHVTGNVSTEHELKFRRWKHKHQQAPEASRNYLSWPITRSFNKRQPIKAHETKRC